MGNHFRKSQEYKSVATSWSLSESAPVSEDPPLPPTEGMDPREQEEKINWQMEYKRLLPDELDNEVRGMPSNKALFKEARSMFSEYDEYENLEVLAELFNGRQMWQYLSDILVSSTFRSYIYWTGNGLEFKIKNPTVVFTELYKIRRGEQPSTMLDPLSRCNGKLLKENQVNWYLRKMQRQTNTKPNIVKSSELCFYFDDHVQICQRLGWDLKRLQDFIRETKLSSVTKR